MAWKDKKDAKASGAAKGGKSAFGLILSVLALTLLAAGGGGFLGMTLVSSLKAGAEAKGKTDEHPPSSPYAGELSVRELAPVVTNLASPANAWVRLQAAIVYDKKAVPNIELTAAEVTNDLSAFIKTLSVSQIQGASGLQDLREDLNERVQVRTEGRVRELMIEMLVVQ